jgi:hypothetical protein
MVTFTASDTAYHVDHAVAIEGGAHAENDNADE